MVKFTKIAAIAGSALVFAGMAFGQATCAGNAPATNIIRVEGTTEQIAPIVITCTNPATAAAATAAGTLSLQIFVAPALPVTSKVLDTVSGKTEAVAILGAGVAFGTTSGSTLNFTGLAVPAIPVGASVTITVSNVRINATSLNVGSGVPPNINATAFISGSAGSVTPSALTFTNVAFAQSGLAASKTFKTFTAATALPLLTIDTTKSGVNSFVICNAYSQKIDAYTGAAAASGKSLAFVLQVNEGFTTAFKDGTSAAAVTAGEGSQIGIAAGAVTATSVSNAVNSATRIKLSFANVPANVTLLVPVGVIPSQNGGGAAKIQLTSSETGAFAVVAASTATAVNGAALAPVTVSSGSGSAVFEVTAGDINNLDQFNIPVFINTTANSVAGSSTAMTTTVSFAPVGSTNVPNFAVGASSTAITTSTFSLCTTSLLFPYVTNQLGFDTGLAIANTSTDPFGTLGATAQAGTCTLNFYGAGAPSPANAVSPNIPTGTVWTQVLSGVAAGFQGYIIAQCQFQYAHGFAFVTDGIGANGGLSQGYLAGVIPDVNQKSRAADPLSIAGAGTGETLGN